ncbi:MAG: DUF1905 domain-containing protein, partial [Acidobacteriota bacterium]
MATRGKGNSKAKASWEAREGAVRVRAVLEKAEDCEACGVWMPFAALEVFGTRARVPVRGTLNGFAFRSSLSPMGGRHILPVNRQMREGAGVQAGDAVEVVLERDDGPRTVTLPPDL